MNRGRFLVFFPCRASYVAAYYDFDGEDLEFPHLHGTVLEEGLLGGGGDGGWEGEREEVCA